MSRDIDDSSENVLSEWPEDAIAARPEGDPDSVSEEHGTVWGTRPAEESPFDEDEPSEPDSFLVPSEAAVDVAEEDAAAVEPEPEAAEPEPEPAEVQSVVEEAQPMSIELSHEHAAGELEIPDGYAVLEGEADGGRRAVGVVVARFNGSVTSRLLAIALAELETAGVRRDAITVLVVPGAFELPLAATALAKTRRFACIVALGCVIRGDTPHFDYVASEAASGLQLAALETGVPVSFGVLTLDRVEQAEPRIEKAAEAVRSALEMADVFSHLRAAASR
jgi:6,7-dimethyl-8-ribityllumazine synthase